MERSLTALPCAESWPRILDHRPLVELEWEGRLGQAIRLLPDSQKYVGRADSPGLKQTAGPRPAGFAVGSDHLPLRVATVRLEVAAVALHGDASLKEPHRVIDPDPNRFAARLA